MRSLLVLAMTVSFIACGGGDDNPGSDAESAMEEWVSIAAQQQGGKAYELVVPEQAERIDRTLFIECMQDGSGQDADVEATESYTEVIDVPVLGEVETWAVTFDVEYNGQSITATRHLIERDGEFYIFYGQEDLDAYAAGECP